MKRTTGHEQNEVSPQIFSWLQTILNIEQLKPQQLANGLVYCLVMNHYYPNLVPIKKICLTPRKYADHINNLRTFSQVLSILKWNNNVGFDVYFDLKQNSKINCLQQRQLVPILTQLHSMLTQLPHTQPKLRTNPSLQSIQSIHSQKSIKSTISSFIASKPLPLSKSSSCTQQTQPPKNNQNLMSGHGLFTNGKTSQGMVSGSSTPGKNSSLVTTGNLMINSINVGKNSKFTVIDQIKGIVGEDGRTDRQKVRQLKELLGIQVEDNKNILQNQEYEKDLLSDDNKQQVAIVIDDN